MGLLDLPPGANEVPGLKLYSLFLKLASTVYMGIGPVIYTLKWGVAWHDAGSPFNIAGSDGINFNAYIFPPRTLPHPARIVPGARGARGARGSRHKAELAGIGT